RPGRDCAGARTRAGRDGRARGSRWRRRGPFPWRKSTWPRSLPGVASDGGADPRRGLPSVERVLAELDPALPHAVRARLARAAVDAARRGTIPAADVMRDAHERARALSLERLGPVVNATG